jgi:outer membrane protein OmpA-like peptidoglycan-associated protein
VTDFAEPRASRPIWLTTLADLALLLVGFFVFLQANRVDPHTLAASFRAGFGVEDKPAIAVDIATVANFAPGSAQVTNAGAALAWAPIATRDPRTRLRVTGEVDGSADDVDPITGSGAILAADRARAVAALLVRAGAAAPGRILIASGRGQRRVVLTLAYEGTER